MKGFFNKLLRPNTIIAFVLFLLISTVAFNSFSQISITASGEIEGAMSDRAVMRALSQTITKTIVYDGTTLTNSSGGVGYVTDTLNDVDAFTADDTANGVLTVCADTTAVAASFTNLRDALSDLIAKANLQAVSIGLTSLTDSTGGSADTTIQAVTSALTGATDGVSATTMNTLRAQYNAAIYNVGLQTNRIARSIGAAPLTVGFVGSPTTTVAACTATVGSASTTDAANINDVTGAFVIWKNNVASLAYKLNVVSASAPTPLILAK